MKYEQSKSTVRQSNDFTELENELATLQLQDNNKTQHQPSQDHPYNDPEKFSSGVNHEKMIDQHINQLENNLNQQREKVENEYKRFNEEYTKNRNKVDEKQDQEDDEHMMDLIL